MSIAKLKEGLKIELEIATNERTEAQDKMMYWSQRLTNAENGVEKIQGALDALDGKSTPQIPFMEIPSITITESKGGTLVNVNGENIILEEGFEVAKNSFGEDCIVPIGTKFERMVEPEKPLPVASILPPLSGDDTFALESPLG